MIVSLVAAYAKNRVIGFEGDIPWSLPADLKRFKKITTGHTIVMGRKTFDSLKKPLPNRRNVVLTRDTNYCPADVDVFQDLNKVLDEAEKRGEEKLFVIGGGEIYRQSFGRADELLLTYVDKDVEGDAFFPEWDKSQWNEVSREDHEGYSFVDYLRIKS